MEWVETTAKTVEQAKELALDQLGVDEPEAEFEVISAPRTGIISRLYSEARVRARVRPRTPPSKVTNPRHRDRGARDSSRKKSGKAEGQGSTRRTKPSSTAGEAKGESSGSGQKARSSRSKRGEARPKKIAPERSSVNATREEETKKMVDVVPLEEQGRIAKEFLDGLVVQFHPSAKVETEEIDDETVSLSIVGDDLGLLIGPRGRTLLALQDLTRTVVSRRTEGRNSRLTVDVGGYRKKRLEALVDFTQQVCQEVLSTGVEKSLEPMNPADRKVVHDTVNEIDGVETVSEGEEPRRRVVIKKS